MSGEPIGYSHGLFPCNGNVRRVAEKFDKKENGGNGDGLINGNETQLFIDYIKEHYYFDIDLSKLKQSTLMEVKYNRRRAENLDYETAKDLLAEDYVNNGMTRAIADYYNKDSKLLSGKAKIAYLPENEYKEAYDYGYQVERQVCDNIYNEKNPPKRVYDPTKDKLTFWQKISYWFQESWLAH